MARTSLSLIGLLDEATPAVRTAVLVGFPVLLRLVLVPLVPDFEADAYTRMELTGSIAEAIRHHRPLLPALYVPVWPPFWHVLCALFEQVWRNAYYAPKVLSAVLGGLTPLIVYHLALRVSPGAGTAQTATLAWALVSVAPLHVMYSTSGMTEAGFVFFCLLAALLFLRAEPGNSWLIAAAAALLPAALTRFDCWILLAALCPMALWQRRATLGTAVLALGVLSLGPLLWFALNFHMTGHPLSFLSAHSAYLDHFYATYQFHTLFADRGPLGWAYQIGAILFTMGIAITWFGVRAATRLRGRDAQGLALWLLVSFVFLAVLWIIRRQVGWRRHYLGIGCGLSALAAGGLLRAPRRLGLGLLALDMAVLVPTSAAMAYVPLRYVQAAAFLRARPGGIYCDEPGVRVLAQLPADRFVDGTPRKEAPALVGWLRERGVRWVVYSGVDYSPLSEVFPWMRAGRSLAPFQLVFDPPGNVPLLQRLYVYELHPMGGP